MSRRGHGGCLGAGPRVRLAARAGVGVEKVLEELERAGARATFFVTGRLGQEQPEVVRRIAEAGHEVGAQTLTPGALVEVSPENFQKQLQQTKAILEDVAGARVTGFRAPDFSMVRETLWALEVVIRLGFEYDSSIMPVHHEDFGVPEARPRVHWARSLEGQTIAEAPPLTVGRKEHRIPLGACPYLRFWPAGLVRQVIRRENRRGEAAVLSFNTWEFDPGQERLEMPLGARVVQYYNLSRTKHKLRFFLKHEEWGTIGEVVKIQLPAEMNQEGTKDTK